MSNNENYIFVLFFICIYSIVMYGKYRCLDKSFQDPFQKKLNLDLDGWSLLHFGFFMLVGYMFPNKFYTAMISGILWELFEYWYGKNPPSFLKNIGHCAITDPDLDTDNNEKIWWYGKTSDVIMNTLGFIVGAWCNKNYYIKNLK